MARERAKLTDKQERILVQCQLMGLTTADMVKISNRLKALDAERDARAEIADVVSTHTVEPIPKGWKITSDKGLVYSCTKQKHRNDGGWHNRGISWKWTIEITKPGTRLKPKTINDHGVYVSDTLTTRVCPEGDKQLYGIMRSIKNKQF